MILVDSSVWIDYFRGAITAQTDKLDKLLGTELLAVGDLILAEVLQGRECFLQFGFGLDQGLFIQRVSLGLTTLIPFRAPRRSCRIKVLSGLFDFALDRFDFFRFTQDGEFQLEFCLLAGVVQTEEIALFSGDGFVAIQIVDQPISRRQRKPHCPWSVVP